MRHDGARSEHLAELKALLRQVKLGHTLATLPKRLALARTGGMDHGEFLELALADEVTRRETSSAMARARAAGLEPTMCLENWDDSAAVTCDRQTWAERPMSGRGGFL